MTIITLTKHLPQIDTTAAPRDLCEAGAPDLAMEVATLLTEWEGSNELAGEFAERLVLFFAGHRDKLLQTKRELDRSST